MPDTSDAEAGSTAAPVTSVARVLTDRAARYGKQLTNHMTRKVQGGWDDEAGTGALTFVEGQVFARLRSEPDALVIELDALADLIERFEEVLGSHLVRFGARDELSCEWQRQTDQQ